MTITTITTWTAKCKICNNPITGVDVAEPGKEPVREHGHDNPIYTLLTDVPGGAHASWPAEDTIQVIQTVTR